MIEITLITLMIIGVLLIPSKKKPPVTKFDDRVIDFVAGRVCLRDAR